jgi:hypothetical protein
MKYPGTIPDQEMEDWFANAAGKAGFVPVAQPGNPCVHAHGPGPAGKRCKECRLLLRNVKSRTYFKCELRGVTNGPGTDHRANWPACGRFVPLG